MSGTRSSTSPQPSTSTGGRAQGNNDQREESVWLHKIFCRRSGRRDYECYVKKCQVVPKIIKTRPDTLETKRGSSGEHVLFTTNYFRILKWQLYQYRVDFSPEVEMISLGDRLVHQQKSKFGGEYLFVRGMLFLPAKLQDDTTWFTSKDREGNLVLLTIKFVGPVPMSAASSIDILKTILRRSMTAMKLQLVGRNIFDPSERIELPEQQSQLWPGYLTSIRQHEVDMLLCVELRNNVIPNRTLHDDLRKCANKNASWWREEFKHSILGMTVFSEHSNKSYRIDGIDFERNPRSTFEMKTGDVSFTEYYASKYNVTIEDQQQPLLIAHVGSSEIALIPELCRRIGLDYEMQTDLRLMTEIYKCTQLTPTQHINKLLAFNKRLQSTEESAKYIKEWNLELDRNLVQVPGRVLDLETILYRDNYGIKPDKNGNWSNSMRISKMFISVPLQRWIVIVPHKLQVGWNLFYNALKMVADDMHYQIAAPQIKIVAEDYIPAYISALEQASNKDLQLIMCIVHTNSMDMYSSIKKHCCIARPIPSQVIASHTIISGNLINICRKVLIKINCKLGGVPWHVHFPLKGLMTVGLNVCPDGISYGGMVATMDMKTSQQYFSAVAASCCIEELSQNFTLNIEKALMAYKKRHNTLPDRILIYRDGVNKIDSSYLSEQELPTIRAMLDKNYDGAVYKMTFIVVSSRSKTKFFTPSNSWFFDNGKKALPGTVVDDIVTFSEQYDFYLVSQSANGSTIIPTTHYNVLYDNSGLSPDRLQILTYKLTHLYYNHQGTIQKPAVCQYAYKLSSLVSKYLRQVPSDLLQNQLYFL